MNGLQIGIHLGLAQGYSVDVHGEGKVLWRREEEERVHEAEEADAAKVGRRVVALEPDPLPMGSVPESPGFFKSIIDGKIVQKCICTRNCF